MTAPLSVSQLLIEYLRHSEYAYRSVSPLVIGLKTETIILATFPILG
jgi:hypothetical protein